MEYKVNKGVERTLTKGLYVEQLQRWREACEQANDWDRSQKLQLAKKSRRGQTAH